MDTIRAAGLAVCALGISFYSDVHAVTETDGGLLTSVAPPPNSRPLDRQSLLAGGEASDLHDLRQPGGRYLVLQADSAGRGMDGDRQR